MKLHHYNQMMAHLVGRQKFSNGGDAILPKPNPLSPQERNQKVFTDYVDRMKKYLGAGVNMPEWFVKDLIFQKADELGIELKAGGGRAGFKYGGTWADWEINYKDQMSFEEYLKDDVIVKEVQAIEKRAEGGRIGFADGPPGTPKRKIYKTITPVTDASRTHAANRGVIIPHDAKWKIQLPGSAIRGSKATTQMVYGKTKRELNTALKDAEKIKYVKPKLPHNDPNHPLYEPPEVKKDKFLVKKSSERVKENISKVIYEEVIGSKNRPETYKKTGNVVTKYKPFIGKENITIEGKGANTLKEAQLFVDNYFKKNPKKVIVPDPDAPKKSKDLKKQKIIAAKGAPLWLTGDPDVHKGHGTTVADPEITIKPSNLFATPKKINVAMAPKKIKDVKEIKTPYTDLDFKIAELETQAKEMKNSNLPDSEKIPKLNAIDKKLTDYAFDSKGYKTVRLSDGTMFNSGQASTQSYDIADIFPPDWSEAQTKKFVSNYLTEEGKLKSQWHVDKDGFLKNDPSTKLSNIDRANIEKSYIFLENVKNAKANAKKILPKVESQFKKFGLTLNKDQVKKAQTFLRSALNKGQNIWKFMPNKFVRKGGGAAAMALDYALFHHLFGVPGTEALIASSGWLTKNDLLQKQIFGTSQMAGIIAEGEAEKIKDNLDAAERLKIAQSTAQNITPFVLDEKEEVVAENKPIYGPYADQIKNLKIP